MGLGGGRHYLALGVLAVALALAGCRSAGNALAPAEITAVPHAVADARQTAMLRGVLYRLQDDKTIRQAERLIIDSPGGLLSEAFAMIPHLERNKTTLVIPDGAKCLSACVLLMAAAERVEVGPDARFMIHHATKFGEHSGRGTAMLKGYLRARDFPEQLLAEGVREKGEVWFNGREAIEWGIADALVCGHIDSPDKLAPCEDSETGES